MSVCIHHTSSPVISQEEKQLLEQLVAEGSQREGYLFDYAFVKKGMAVLTCKGKYAIR